MLTFQCFSSLDPNDFFQMSTEFTPLKSDEIQLFELARLSNINIDERIFKVILELLKLNVKPEAIIQVLKVLAKSTPMT